MSLLRQRAIEHIKDLLGIYEALPVNPGTMGNYRVDRILTARMRQALDRWAKPDSSYHVLANTKAAWAEPTDLAAAALKALLADIEAGYVETIETEVHAITNSGLMGIADGFLADKLHLPAAVIMGVTLEQHLRSMCVVHNIDTERVNNKGERVYLKAADLAAALMKEAVILPSKKDMIDSWLKTRNAAVHGRTDELDVRDVNAMSTDIKRFLDEYPA